MQSAESSLIALLCTVDIIPAETLLLVETLESARIPSTPNPQLITGPHCNGRRGESERGRAAARARQGEDVRVRVCCMHLWRALATAVLLASEGPVVAFTGTLQFSSGNIQRITSSRHMHLLQQTKGSRLRSRRRINPSVRLHPAEAGVPDVAAPCDHSLGAESVADSPGSLPQKGNKLTERGGLLLLATVPLVWGTYSPTVKYLYQAGESPPGLLFNFACYAVSVLTFAAVAGLNNARTRRTAAAQGMIRARP